jgi:hypothetical protein
MEVRAAIHESSIWPFLACGQAGTGHFQGDIALTIFSARRVKPAAVAYSSSLLCYGALTQNA